MKYINTYTNWKEIKNIIGFNQNQVFDFKNFKLTAIHLPGHSPGHVGFKIESKERNTESKDVLFTADIGLDKFGPWYGLKNSSIKDYLISIKKIDKIYQSKDWIITSSHGTIIMERIPNLFLDLLERIKNTKQKLINFILNKKPTNLEDLLLQGIYYRKNSVSKLDPLSKKIYFFWEAFIIFNLFKEFIIKNGFNLFKIEINQEKLQMKI